MERTMINSIKNFCLAIRKSQPKQVFKKTVYEEPEHSYELGYYSSKYFCPTCGERVYDEKYCRECGQALKY